MNSYFKACVYSIFFAACLMLTAGSAVAAKKTSAAKKGYWKFRTRVITVAPNTDSGEVSGLPGTAVEVESDRTLEVDFTYMFNPRFGLELILGTTRHDIVGSDGLDGVDIGNTAVLPPTLTFQYHLLPNSKIRPYIGLGINYTTFYATYASEKLISALAGVYQKDTAEFDANLSLSDSFGLAKQFGIDIMISDRAFFNVDVKYIDMATTATIETSEGTHKVDVKINPWVFGLGVGMSF